MSKMSDMATELLNNVKAHGRAKNGDEESQILALAEECGEFVGAYRRWSGRARRDGTKEEMTAELADVVITAYVVACALDVDLDDAIAEKLTVVFSRGWIATT